MVAFSTGLTTAKDDAIGSAERGSTEFYGSGRKHTACSSEDIDANEELVLSQKDAPGTHKIVESL